MPSGAPTLAICIPTAHGRAETVRQGLESVAAQLRPEHAGRVSVVVSDNASRDGTDAVVAEAASRGLPVRYHRHDRNLGAPLNIAGVVGLAEAEWCWLLSSDDVLLPGALDRALELLAGHAGLTGVTVNQLVVDRTLTVPARVQATPAVPALHEVTVVRGLDAIVGELGWILSGLSSHIVRRDAWVTAEAGLHARLVRKHTWFPQTAIALRMAAAAPAWLWCPEKLVAVRTDNLDPVLLRPRLQGEFLRDLDLEWRAAVGRGGEGRRRVLARYRVGLETVGTFEAVAIDHARGGRDGAWLLWRFALVFGRSAAFWRRDAPRLVVPPRLAAWRRVRSRAAPRPDLAAGLTATLPEVVGRADLVRLEARVENRGRAAWRSGEAVASAGWTRAGATHDGGATVLRSRLRPGRSRATTLVLTAPIEPGEWRLRISLGDAAVEAGVRVAP